MVRPTTREKDMAASTGKVSTDQGDLRVVAYPGDNAVLLAMSLADNAVGEPDNNLAGFAIWRTAQGKPEQALQNRLSFDTQVTRETQPHERVWTDSSAAPFQKFRWVDVPPFDFSAPITYRVMAKYFTGRGKELRDGPQAQVTVNPPQLAHKKFRVAFTRGYASSQAYADKFHNAPIRPEGPKTPDFKTKPYIDSGQYQWLGATARERLFEFIKECEDDKNAKVDVFAYDLDEPDVVNAICGMGKKGRVRAILDNAKLHMPAKNGNPPEVKAATLITAALGHNNVKRGHFTRYQHNKVFIKRDGEGHAQKVLFGSMNFSVRGLYVQANNVMVVDDPKTAGYFAAAFDNAFDHATDKNVSASAFAKAPVAQNYNPISSGNTADLPKSVVALSPHSDAKISLTEVADRIRKAQSSVLFAVMEPTGGGQVLNSLRAIAAQPIIFSYGTVETDSGLAVQDPNGAMGALASFAYLHSKVPWPFSEEWSGKGLGEKGGMSIHHKFVVIDFNADNPVVFTGSSNLAKGGEEANGDSLIMIQDPVIANLYAIEAVKLFDHYSFRKAMAKATHVEPLSLWYPGKPNADGPWWKPYYDKSHIKFRDRLLFAEEPLPSGVRPVKNVDWAAIDEVAEEEAKKKKKPGAKGKTKTAGAKSGAKKKKKRSTAKKAASKKKSSSRKKAAKKKTSSRKKAAKKKTSSRKKAARKKSRPVKKRRTSR
jgi:phosphatidylserine/phosphatidylglycerophosphate/cardiolipin synthase-like enzyme